MSRKRKQDLLPMTPVGIPFAPQPLSTQLDKHTKHKIHPDRVECLNSSPGNVRRDKNDEGVCAGDSIYPRRKRINGSQKTRRGGKSTIKDSPGKRDGGRRSKIRTRKDSSAKGSRGSITRDKSRGAKHLVDMSDELDVPVGEGSSISLVEKDQSDENEECQVQKERGQDGECEPPCTVFEPKDGKTKLIGDSVALVVGLEVGERLCFLGAVRIRCASGQAEVSGYSLPSSTQGTYLEVHSPRWMGLVVVSAIRASARLAEGDSAAQKAGKHQGDNSQEEKVEETVARISKKFPVVVVFRPVECNSLTFLSAQADADSLHETYCGARSEGWLKLATTEVSRKARTRATRLRVPGMQVVAGETSDLRRLATPTKWAKAIGTMLRAPCELGRGLVLVCGVKGVGKSTFCRLLVNRMLIKHSRVAYIDCDLGQPEFTVPGLVSLHLLDSPVLGPPHANIRRPHLAYFIGTASSKLDPMRYSAAVRSLVEHYAMLVEQYIMSETSASSGGANIPFLPLVVNTDGWMKGMGEDVLGAVIDAVRPCHIVHIQKETTKQKKDLKQLPHDCKVHIVGAHVVRSPQLESPKASDLRNFRMLAYFFGPGEIENTRVADRETADVMRREPIDGVTIQGGVLHDKKHELAARLAAERPRRVPWSAVRVSFMASQISPDLVLHAINGSVVGLVSTPPHCNKGELSKGSDSAAGGLVCLAETPLAPCVGLGLVRSVNVVKQELYVLTPEPLEVLKQVNLLVKGSLHLPSEVLFDPHLCSCPYFSAEGLGGDVQLVRQFQMGRMPRASSRDRKSKPGKNAR